MRSESLYRVVFLAINHPGFINRHDLWMGPSSGELGLGRIQLYVSDYPISDRRIHERQMTFLLGLITGLAIGTLCGSWWSSRGRRRDDYL